ncbi:MULTISPECIES: acid phosphatase [Rhodococcus]|uniref:Acid phosphatase n=1 Tax=Rhodococcus oxybenzonivorans TaxID=1990687 RepID=A0AAE5A993_9NOCA|nr:MULTISPECIES: acid phosphatase [Rhodococcus]MDV7244634.1 acid phosphatase [Rhodococcus oxybenzonivorans]MDV7268266.1 acid phosphatase [Rhodococcus oxybenzonivorans]MDV7275866.1 acid phosphatase [Rhodococcus oxybenzonivorans]MDV7332644.1 acid phosphatase [Rhodococcus oxybenzonivorans]MDV7346440.1 acid phosphatase [Rhodococcus oxybenzonivorans]
MPPSDSPSERRIVLLRHGETEWARAGKHTGRTDIPLTDVGERQARTLGTALDALRLRNPLVIVSPRRRAQDTAQLAGLKIHRTWDALVEWDYGTYEGLTTPDIRTKVPDWTVWTHPCPRGEQAEQIHARCDLVLSVAHSQLPDRDVILVGHGHFSRALIARWADLPVSEGRRFALSPGAYSILGFEHGAQQLVTHNVTIEEGSR